MQFNDHERANSESIACILLIAITILVAALMLLCLDIPDFELDSGPPALFTIEKVSHTDRPPGSQPNLDSRIILRHSGAHAAENDLLEAKIFRNGDLLSCRITTLNGHNFISTHHYGVQTLSGSGCQSDYWRPGESIAIDLSDGTLRPGDVVRVDVVRKSDNQVISRDQATA